MTLAEWKREGTRLFGPNMGAWRWKCPACGHVAKAQDWTDAGAPEGAIAFSCIGRWIEGSREAFGEGEGPCNYAGGGLIGMNPVEVDGGHYFAFAPPAAAEEGSATP